jgi:cbb3-type cytochrome oxidase subunit 3
MTETILFFALLAAAVYYVFKNQKEEKDKNDYENIDLDDLINQNPDIPDITYSDSSELLQPAEVFELSDREIFARTLYGEGRSLTVTEIEKIAWVIRNRVEDNGRENFPDSYKDVCLQKYQFSCWNSLYNQSMTDNQRKVRKKVLNDQYSFDLCYKIAGTIMTTPSYQNPLPNVQHYVLNTDQVKISGDKIESSPYPDWVKNMRIVSNDGKGGHIFLA